MRSCVQVRSRSPVGDLTVFESPSGQGLRNALSGPVGHHMASWPPGER